MDLITREGGSIDLIFDILEELGAALRDLITGDYSGVCRSLRLTLEFLVFWADFEGDGRTGAEAYAEYSQHRMTWEEFIHKYNELYTMRYIRIKERLIIKEKQRRERSFQDMTKGLSILSGEKGEYLFSNEQIKKNRIESAQPVLASRKY